jgi:FtsH-binding integral membrane protein
MQFYENANNSKEFENKEDRLNFIRKVFGILGTQIILTACLTIIPKESYSVRLWMVEH